MNVLRGHGLQTGPQPNAVSVTADLESILFQSYVPKCQPVAIPKV